MPSILVTFSLLKREAVLLPKLLALVANLLQLHSQNLHTQISQFGCSCNNAITQGTATRYSCYNARHSCYRACYRYTYYATGCSFRTWVLPLIVLCPCQCRVAASAIAHPTQRALVWHVRQMTWSNSQHAWAQPPNHLMWPQQDTKQPSKHFCFSITCVTLTELGLCSPSPGASLTVTGVPALKGPVNRWTHADS